MDRLNSLMESTGTKNYQLAKVIGVKEGAIRFWRKGRSIPRGKNLEALAAYFRIHPAWLLYGDKAYASQPIDKLTACFEDAAAYVAKHPDALPYIEKMVRGVIGTGQFQSHTVQKKKARHKSA